DIPATEREVSFGPCADIDPQRIRSEDNDDNVGFHSFGLIMMSQDESEPVKRPREPVRRKFYAMDFNYSRSGPLGFSLHSLSGMTLRPEPGHRGFPDWPEKLCILFDRRAGRLPADLERF